MTSLPTNANRSNAVAELRGIAEELRQSDFVPLRSRLERTLSALERLGGRRPTIAIHNGSANTITIEAATGLAPCERDRGRYEPGEGVTGQVFRTRRRAVILDVAAEPGFLNRTRARDRIGARGLGFVCVPIVTPSEVLGTLSLDVPAGAIGRAEELADVCDVAASIVAPLVARLRDQLDEDESRRRKATREARPENEWQPASIVGSSSAIREVYRLIRQVGPSDATVLIRGESGTGKELVARSIHELSSRRSGPLVCVNCAALPEQLVASELFGHVRGAYTGADGARKGRFELADNGTIFLDEIGEISPAIQVKLLRVLQEGEIDRLGDERSSRVDVRVIAATNADLEEAMEKGRFRRDLYYRLAGFPIYLPPLRERDGDVTLLADHFLELYARRHQRDVRRISTPAIELLTTYHWPGNVRELENVIGRAVLLTDDGVIRSHDLPPTLQTGQSSGTSRAGTLEERMKAYEREILIEALRDCGNNVAAAARLLGTTPRVVAYRLGKQGLKP